MNFSKMSGYEFEDFIANLLRQKGFKVTQTDYSNDGGVDLIAEYNQPLFSGKYIVQCKKYTNNLVGQPELRDLYGVVMSESANKGILITTSDFTTQAKNFAKGKNIELINGSILNSLIEGVNVTTIEEPELKFWEYPDFDKKNYDFLKKRLKAGKKNEKNYDNLITLLESYILNGKVDICKAGLIDEIRLLREEKRINTNKDYVYNPSNKRTDLNELDLCLIEGDLAKATDELIKNKSFGFSSYPSFLSFYENALACKDSYIKNIKVPSFLSSYITIYNRGNLRYYEIEYNQDLWNKIEPIVEKNFTNLYTEKELREIVSRFKLLAFDTADFVENSHYFDKYENNLLGAKHCFIEKLKTELVPEYDYRRIENMFRYYFLSKFEPENIKKIKKITFWKSQDYINSPLFGLPYILMLYSAYKQIGFELYCSAWKSYIKIPKSISEFPDEIPEITKILCPDYFNDYRNYVELEIKAYKEFLNGAFDNIFNPVWHDKYYKKSDQEIISEIKEVLKRHNFIK